MRLCVFLLKAQDVEDEETWKVSRGARVLVWQQFEICSVYKSTAAYESKNQRLAMEAAFCSRRRRRRRSRSTSSSLSPLSLDASGLEGARQVSFGSHKRLFNTNWLDDKLSLYFACCCRCSRGLFLNISSFPVSSLASVCSLSISPSTEARNGAARRRGATNERTLSGRVFIIRVVVYRGDCLDQNRSGPKMCAYELYVNFTYVLGPRHSSVGPGSTCIDGLQLKTNPHRSMFSGLEKGARNLSCCGGISKSEQRLCFKQCNRRTEFQAIRNCEDLLSDDSELNAQIPAAIPPGSSERHFEAPLRELQDLRVPRDRVHRRDSIPERKDHAVEDRQQPVRERFSRHGSRQAREEVSSPVSICFSSRTFCCWNSLESFSQELNDLPESCQLFSGSGCRERVEKRVH